MPNDLINITNHVEIELQLLASAFYFGDFYPVHQLIDKKSRLFMAFANKKIDDIQTKSEPMIIQPETLSQSDQEQYRQFYPGIFEDIQKKYAEDLRKNPVPPPAQFFEEFAENAINLGKFMAAASALDYIKALDKRIDRRLSNAIRILRSREILALPEDVDQPHADSSLNEVEIAAREFYTAIKLKQPLGPKFQELGVELQFRNKMLWRKYEQYVSSNNEKEIFNFVIHYLSDDSGFTARIGEGLAKAKIRKIFVKKLAEFFSGGTENHQRFLSQYRAAVAKLAEASQASDYFDVQELLLGRKVKSDEVFQYFKELMVQHPISALVCRMHQTPDQQQYVVPYMAHERSLVELLELS